MSVLASLVHLVIQVLIWMIIIRALLSWVSPDPANPLVRLLADLTDPVLLPVRRLIPRRLRTGMDFSPLVAIALLYGLDMFLYTFLLSIGSYPTLGNVLVSIPASLLEAAATVLNMVIFAFIFVLVIRALVSWFHVDPFNPMVVMLSNVTEPMLRPIRLALGAELFRAFDFSPVIAILLLYGMSSWAAWLLHQLALSLRLAR